MTTVNELTGGTKNTKINLYCIFNFSQSSVTKTELQELRKTLQGKKMENEKLQSGTNTSTIHVLWIVICL